MPSHDRGHHARLVERVEVLLVGLGARRAPAVAHRAVAEVRDDRVVDRQPARDGDAVPAALAVVDELVAGDPERHLGDRVVSELRLLHEQHVGRGALEPPLDGLEPRPERVDVPGRDPHRSRA